MYTISIYTIYLLQLFQYYFIINIITSFRGASGRRTFTLIRIYIGIVIGKGRANDVGRIYSAVYP